MSDHAGRGVLSDSEIPGAPLPLSVLAQLAVAGWVVVGGIVAIEGEDELFDGADGGSVEGGGVEAPGLHGAHDDLIEIVAEALDELLVGNVA